MPYNLYRSCQPGSLWCIFSKVADTLRQSLAEQKASAARPCEVQPHLALQNDWCFVGANAVGLSKKASGFADNAVLSWKRLIDLVAASTALHFDCWHGAASAGESLTSGWNLIRRCESFQLRTDYF